MHHIAIGGPSVIFIVGAPRSGTTLCLNIMRSHPRSIHLKAETLGLESRGSSLESGAFHNEWLFLEHCSRLQILIDRNPDRVFVEKTPIHIHSLEKLLNALPRSRGICMIRDGREVISSLLTVGRSQDRWFDAPTTIDEAISLWLPFAKAILALAGKDRIITSRYETLMQETYSEAARLCGDVGLDTDHLERQILFSNDLNNLPFPGVRSDDPLRKWQNYLSDHEQYIFAESEAAALNEQLGYS